jgi:FkbM family methyltransferase
MFQGLVRLRDLGFAPTGILDVGVYEGNFSRGARQIFREAYILMIVALAEKGPELADICREVGNADCLIAMLGDREMEASSFFVVNAEIVADLNKSGSSKFKENSNFPVEERTLPQRTLGSILADRGQTFQLLKLDVQGAELDVLRGLGYQLSDVEVIPDGDFAGQLQQRRPTIDVVLSELNGMGFVVYDIVEECRDLGGRL